MDDPGGGRLYWTFFLKLGLAASAPSKGVAPKLNGAS